MHCQPNSASRKDLIALVHLLGGYVLALEIAAAQTKKLSRLPTILHELEQGIGRGTLSGLKLSSGDERDENLERSFALSYERMTPEQQRLFRALGIFAEEAPITADAAASIWSIEDLNTAQLALFELTDLALLTEIETVTSNTTTFRLHNLLCVYARALLAQHNELMPLNRAHTQFFIALSWQAVTSSPRDYEILDLHLSDLLLALAWSSHDDPPLLPSLLDYLRQFLLIRGQSVLLETYLPQALAVANQSGDRLRSANLLKSMGDLESQLGNVEEARRLYDEALPLYRVERMRREEANVYMSLGDMYIEQTMWAEARTSYEKAQPLYKAVRDPLGLANTLIDLGLARFELGDYVQGISDVQQAAILYRQVQAFDWAEQAEERLIDLQARLQKQNS